MTFIIIPIFAFANAGVEIPFQELGGIFSNPIILGILVGLFFGKQIGIMSFAWIVVRLGWADLPKGLRWSHLYGASILGGIGFTMSLFIGDLAFPDPDMLQQTKLGILLASILSGLIGYFVLKKTIQ